MRVVEETSRRVLRRYGSSGEGQQHCPDETCVSVSHAGGTVGPLRKLSLEINERLIEGDAPRRGGVFAENDAEIRFQAFPASEVSRTSRAGSNQGSANVFDRNTAICPRVFGLVGQ